jgi:hypothetical protein
MPETVTTPTEKQSIASLVAYDAVSGISAA